MMMPMYTDYPDRPMDWNITNLCLDFIGGTQASYARSITPMPLRVQRILNIVYETQIHAEQTTLYKRLEEAIKFKRLDDIL